MGGYKNSSENLSAAKVGEHVPSSFPISTILSFKDIKNKHDVYRREDCMINFRDS